MEGIVEVLGVIGCIFELAEHSADHGNIFDLRELASLTTRGTSQAMHATIQDRGGAADRHFWRVWTETNHDCNLWVTSVAVCRFFFFACLLSAGWIAPAAATASLSQESINSASIAGRTDLSPPSSPMRS